MRRQSQGILEYVVLLSVVITALLLMGHYVRNSLSGRYRQTADTFGGGEVYRPQFLGGNRTVIETDIIENR